jgi:hypothetical protein
VDYGREEKDVSTTQLFKQIYIIVNHLKVVFLKV